MKPLTNYQALVAAGGWNLSTAFLSAKAKAQARDSKGRFIKMGGLVKWEDAAKKWRWGFVTDVAGDGKTITVKENGKAAFALIKPKQLTVVKALIPSNPTEAKKLESQQKAAQGGALMKTVPAIDIKPEDLQPADPEPGESSPLYKDTDGFKKIGGQGGSNPGGTYEDPETGEKFYVKKAKSEQHAANEVLAAKLYEAAGINVPEVYLTEFEGGDPGVASKIVDGLKPVLPSGNADFNKEARKGFAMDAWLANWDVVGLANDNLLATPDGKPIRVDTGGALLYRAMGSPKGDLFGDAVGETETLRNSDTNAQSAALFGQMSNAEIAKDIADTVNMISDEQLDQLIDDLPFTTETVKSTLKTKLKNRKANLNTKFDVPAPVTIPDEPPAPAPAPAPSDKLDPGYGPLAKKNLDGTISVAAMSLKKGQLVKVQGNQIVELDDKWTSSKGVTGKYVAGNLKGGNFQQKSSKNDKFSVLTPEDAALINPPEESAPTGPIVFEEGPFQPPQTIGEQLDDAEIEAIDEYTGDGYAAINNYLRGGLPKSMAKEDIDSIVALMDSALKLNTVASDATVYRGITGGEVIPEAPMALGTLIEDKGFMSTSSKFETGKSFGSYGKDSAIFEIEVPAGAHVIDVDKFVGNTGESEFIFPRNSKLEVTEDGVLANGKRYIKARLLEGAPNAEKQEVIGDDAGGAGEGAPGAPGVDAGPGDGDAPSAQSGEVAPATGPKQKGSETLKQFVEKTSLKMQLPPADIEKLLADPNIPVEAKKAVIADEKSKKGLPAEQVAHLNEIAGLGDAPADPPKPPDADPPAAPAGDGDLPHPSAKIGATVTSKKDGFSGKVVKVNPKSGYSLVQSSDGSKKLWRKWDTLDVQDELAPAPSSGTTGAPVPAIQPGIKKAFDALGDALQKPELIPDDIYDKMAEVVNGGQLSDEDWKNLNGYFDVLQSGETEDVSDAIWNAWKNFQTAAGYKKPTAAEKSTPEGAGSAPSVNPDKSMTAANFGEFLKGATGYGDESVLEAFKKIESDSATENDWVEVASFVDDAYTPTDADSGPGFALNETFGDMMMAYGIDPKLIEAAVKSGNTFDLNEYVDTMPEHAVAANLLNEELGAEGMDFFGELDMNASVEEKKAWLLDAFEGMDDSDITLSGPALDAFKNLADALGVPMPSNEKTTPDGPTISADKLAKGDKIWYNGEIVEVENVMTSSNGNPMVLLKKSNGQNTVVAFQPDQAITASEVKALNEPDPNMVNVGTLGVGDKVELAGGGVWAVQSIETEADVKSIIFESPAGVTLLKVYLLDATVKLAEKAAPAKQASGPAPEGMIKSMDLKPGDWVTNQFGDAVEVNFAAPNGVGQINVSYVDTDGDEVSVNLEPDDLWEKVDVSVPDPAPAGPKAQDLKVGDKIKDVDDEVGVVTNVTKVGNQVKVEYTLDEYGSAKFDASVFPDDTAYFTKIDDASAPAATFKVGDPIAPKDVQPGMTVGAKTGGKYVVNSVTPLSTGKVSLNITAVGSGENFPSHTLGADHPGWHVVELPSSPVPEPEPSGPKVGEKIKGVDVVSGMTLLFDDGDTYKVDAVKPPVASGSIPMDLTDVNTGASYPGYFMLPGNSGWSLKELPPETTTNGIPDVALADWEKELLNGTTNAKPVSTPVSSLEVGDTVWTSDGKIALAKLVEKVSAKNWKIEELGNYAHWAGKTTWAAYGSTVQATKGAAPSAPTLVFPPLDQQPVKLPATDLAPGDIVWNGPGSKPLAKILGKIKDTPFGTLWEIEGVNGSWEGLTEWESGKAGTLKIAKGGSSQPESVSTPPAPEVPAGTLVAGSTHVFQDAKGKYVINKGGHVLREGDSVTTKKGETGKITGLELGAKYAKVKMSDGKTKARQIDTLTPVGGSTATPAAPVKKVNELKSGDKVVIDGVSGSVLYSEKSNFAKQGAWYISVKPDDGTTYKNVFVSDSGSGTATGVYVHSTQKATLEFGASPAAPVLTPAKKVEELKYGDKVIYAGKSATVDYSAQSIESPNKWFISVVTDSGGSHAKHVPKGDTTTFSAPGNASTPVSKSVKDVKKGEQVYVNGELMTATSSEPSSLLSKGEWFFVLKPSNPYANTKTVFVTESSPGAATGKEYYSGESLAITTLPGSGTGTSSPVPAAPPATPGFTPANELKVGDKVLHDGKVATVTKSQPSGPYEGMWHVTVKYDNGEGTKQDHLALTDTATFSKKIVSADAAQATDEDALKTALSTGVSTDGTWPAGTTFTQTGSKQTPQFIPGDIVGKDHKVVEWSKDSVVLTGKQDVKFVGTDQPMTGSKNNPWETWEKDAPPIPPNETPAKKLPSNLKKNDYVKINGKLETVESTMSADDDDDGYTETGITKIKLVGKSGWKDYSDDTLIEYLGNTKLEDFTPKSDTIGASELLPGATGQKAPNEWQPGDVVGDSTASKLTVQSVTPGDSGVTKVKFVGVNFEYSLPNDSPWMTWPKEDGKPLPKGGPALEDTPDLDAPPDAPEPDVTPDMEHPPADPALPYLYADEYGTNLEVPIGYQVYPSYDYGSNGELYMTDGLGNWWRKTGTDALKTGGVVGYKLSNALNAGPLFVHPGSVDVEPKIAEVLTPEQKADVLQKIDEYVNGAAGYDHYKEMFTKLKTLLNDPSGASLDDAGWQQVGMAMTSPYMIGISDAEPYWKNLNLEVTKLRKKVTGTYAGEWFASHSGKQYHYDANQRKALAALGLSDNTLGFVNTKAAVPSHNKDAAAEIHAVVSDPDRAKIIDKMYGAGTASGIVKKTRGNAFKPALSGNSSPYATPLPAIPSVPGKAGATIQLGDTVIAADGQGGIAVLILPEGRVRVRRADGTHFTRKGVQFTVTVASPDAPAQSPVSSAPYVAKPRPPFEKPDWSKSLYGTGTAQNALDEVHKSNWVANHGYSFAADHDQVEDLDVHVSRILDQNGQELLELKFKVTPKHGKELHKRYAADPGWAQTGLKIEERDMSNGNQLAKLQGTYKISSNKTDGWTYSSTTPDGAKVFLHQTAKPGTGPYAAHNLMQIRLPANATPDDIAKAMYDAGIDSPGPATPAALKRFGENRLMSIFASQTNANTETLGTKRNDLLEKIKTDWGITWEDLQVHHGANGRIEVLVPQSVADKIASKTGVNVFHHNVAGGDSTFVEIATNPHQALLSTTTRWTEGVPTQGMSSGTDLGTGGADYVFFSPRSNPSGHGLMYDAKRMFRRTDFYANNNDKFGKRLTNVDVLSQIYHGAYETMFKHRAALDDALGYVTHDRESVIKKIKAKGITHIGGRTVEQFVVSSPSEFTPPDPLVIESVPAGGPVL